MRFYSPNWYLGFFRDLALDYWQLAGEEHDTSAEIALIEDFVELKAGDRVLDVFCGYGRHSLVYAERGMAVTAVDVAGSYIEALRGAALLQGVSLRAVCSDVLSWEGEKGVYDLVVCMGNSIGYLNREQLGVFFGIIGGCLKGDGLFVFHTSVLAESVFPNLMEYDWKQVGDVTFLLKNTYWVEEGCLESEVRFIRGGTEREGRMYHYVYSLSELVHWLRSFGFEVVGVLNLDGGEYEYGDIEAYFVVRLREGGDVGF